MSEVDKQYPDELKMRIARILTNQEEQEEYYDEDYSGE